ncbi:MAG TPA: hypothetical protein VG892_06925 [Terriglobales bacterium]|jgi:virginiamycin B lyase|nr:hypothetical protein [Terriglobales bacterium]
MKQRYRMLAGMALMIAATMAWAAVGELKVNIKEWDVPTPRSRPHDPAVAPDGSLWWAGQVANKLGRLDPATGEMREYDLKTPKSGPHGIVADREGNIWYTANFVGMIGKLNPKTGEITEYKMPDPKARDPHSLAVDQKGVVWFTLQGANMVGRLDPKSGKIDLKDLPSPKVNPYGIVVNSKGVPFFCELKGGKLASINPQTMEITEYALPEGSGPRRIAVAADDTLYYTDFVRGYLGKFDPKSGKHEEWASPGGEKSEPYGITITPDGSVYYSESGIMPNTMVRFDPKSKEFSSTTIPSGGKVIRNMVSTKKGDVYVACSGVNKVGIVELSKMQMSKK